MKRNHTDAGMVGKSNPCVSAWTHTARPSVRADPQTHGASHSRSQRPYSSCHSCIYTCLKSMINTVNITRAAPSRARVLALYLISTRVGLRHYCGLTQVRHIFVHWVWRVSAAAEPDLLRSRFQHWRTMCQNLCNADVYTHNIYIYICISLSLYVYILCIYIYIYTSMHTSITYEIRHDTYVCMYACIYTYIHTYIHT